MSEEVVYSRHALHAASGWLNGYEYLLYGEYSPAVLQLVVNPRGSAEWWQVARLQTRGIYAQFVMSCAATWVFVRNARIAIRYLRHNTCDTLAWCVAIQAFVGCIFGFYFAYGFLLPSGPSCRACIDFTIVGLATSATCINVILLRKAYAAHGSKLIHLSDHDHAKRWLRRPLPSLFPWMKLALEVPANLVFSAAFLAVVARQYRRSRSECWLYLEREGIAIMCLVVGSSLICAICAVLELLGDWSDMFWVGDWVVSSLLLVYHVDTVRRDIRRSLQPLSSGMYTK
ncbi:hypothetical protein THASP1DRAFT_30942 [Thamnocephalis sphaerospora]|uniref:Uncharacterized protein n=1 Tax=Thamnocephalis sphaerospora TaxID=78915 RepID=A0A4P9XMU3_9FUNG|nr:hypothetical protein THASP1DRAFT_30942 [Thamnocephalis sphaerospora]|eukprot:RKP07238.1 hypothetical protein THASP1DRAFT_30942 [Thamnocephalis sphaerospora]